MELSSLLNGFSGLSSLFGGDGASNAESLIGGIPAQDSALMTMANQNTGSVLNDMIANPETAFGGFQPDNMTMAPTAGVELTKGMTDLAKLNQPGFLENIGNGLQDYLSNATMKDFGALAKGAGGLYESLKAGDMVDEKIKASQEARKFAKDEQARKANFINETKNTFSGGNKSNYYTT